MRSNYSLGEKTVLLINFFLFQAFMVAAIGTLAWADTAEFIAIPRYWLSIIAVICSVAVGLGSVICLKELIRMAEKERQADRNMVFLEESRHLIDVLRAHRHDFLNHVQVIYGLAQMGKLDRMAAYISELTDNMRSESDVSRLAIPELAAFLLKKASAAVNQGIKFEIDVDSDLVNLAVSSTEIVSIVGNLLDNAFFAVCQDSGEERHVLLMAWEEGDGYKITVGNSGTPIPEHLKEKIFEKGFTTKGRQGSGLGLFIVKSFLERKGGGIKLIEGSELPTCFEVMIPKATA